MVYMNRIVTMILTIATPGNALINKYIFTACTGLCLYVNQPAIVYVSLVHIFFSHFLCELDFFFCFRSHLGQVFFVLFLYPRPPFAPPPPPPPLLFFRMINDTSIHIVYYYDDEEEDGTLM